MGKRSFEETKQFASDNLEAMHERLDELRQSYQISADKGDTEQAEEIKEQLDSLETDISFEEEMFRQAFY